MRCAIVIPARLASTRFPGKPLCDLLGKPMIQWVVESARKAEVADKVLVATPDQEIVDACAAFGAEAVLTSFDHQTGTDRIAEVARSVEADVYVNVQGDEPLIRPEDIHDCAVPLLNDASIQMGSIMTNCPEDEAENPAVVKVVVDQDNFALYFSRHAIPFPRHERKGPLLKHIGLYAYRRDALLAFSQFAMTPLEHAESLEQLRFMEHGIRIKMTHGHGSALAVDTPEQAEEVRRLLSEAHGA